MKKFLALLMIVACGLMIGCGGGKGTDGKFRIVTSFYPIYIDALNLAAGIDDVEVVNLTKPTVGCLHDYQLTTEEMKILETADILIVNGFGMESFLDKVTAAQPSLKIIDLSKAEDITPIVENGVVNPHVWLSVTYDKRQVIELSNRLSELDKDHALNYRKNALDYVTRLDMLREEMHNALDFLPHKDIVTFHEAFPYFAKEFDLNVIAVIEREPGIEPTPKELQETIEKLNAIETKVIFTEPQYPAKAAETLARETGAKIYVLDPIVSGDGSPDSYINVMLENMKTLQSALR